MAKMYPNRPLAGTVSNAERRVFHALKDLLPDEYTVFHSVPILVSTDHESGLTDGEIDFLIAHPDKGLLVIEVKGGGIIYDPESGNWMTRDINGLTHFIKDPYRQAKDNKYKFKNSLKGFYLTKPHNYWLSHAVWFPDLDLKKQKIGLTPNTKKITLDCNDLNSAKESIRTLFQVAVGSKASRKSTEVGIKALVESIAPNLELQVILSTRIEQETELIYEATKSQYKVITLLGQINRALIRGCAGSGKTLLALDKAYRLSNTGKSVLFLCFNRNLAKWLKKQTHAESVNVFHFHGLCTHFCNLAGIPIPQPDPKGELGKYFIHELPNSLIDSLDLVEERFDAVIVDEGQDFNSAWWLPISELLKDPEEGIFYIFFDSNQSIYSQELNFPIPGPLFKLTENCRNTKLIHDEVIKFYQGDSYLIAIGPDGRKPEFIFLDEGVDEKQVCKKLIKQLVHVERLEPEVITILTPSKAGRSIWEEGLKIGNLELSWDLESRHKIRCSTIHSYKGLESPVVILSELDKVYKPNIKELLYVGMSRACNHLIVLVPKDFHDSLEFNPN